MNRSNSDDECCIYLFKQDSYSSYTNLIFLRSPDQGRVGDCALTENTVASNEEIFLGLLGMIKEEQ